MADAKWDLVADQINFNLKINLARFISKINIDSKILDFGCGYGRICSELFENGYNNVKGIDQSKNMITRGREKFPALCLDFVSSKVLPYADCHFDTIVCCAVFTCIPTIEEREITINELYRILKPSGIFHLVEFSSTTTKTHLSSFGVPMRHSSPEEYRKLISRFSIQEEEIIETETLKGKPSQSYSVFAVKQTKS